MAEQADMETAQFVPQEARLKIKKKKTKQQTYQLGEQSIYFKFLWQPFPSRAGNNSPVEACEQTKFNLQQFHISRN